MALYWESYFQRASRVQSALVHLSGECEKAAHFFASTLESGGKLIFIGNGGSASDAQHLAAEFVGRFLADRGPLSAVCLNTDTSVMTAIANDFGYSHVFARQVQGLARSGDVLVAISTSGRSQSIVSALELARSLPITTVLLTSRACPIETRNLCTLTIAVDCDVTAHIQEAHISLGQAICGRTEQLLLDLSK